jgi:integrase/recombinase XerD
VNNIGLDEVDDRTLERFAKHRCRCGGYRRAMRFSDKYLNRVRRFISFLVTHSVIAPLSNAAANAVEPLVVDDQE